VLAEATEGLEVLVPSYDATDEPREAKDGFLGVFVAAGFLCAASAGFLDKLFKDGRLIGGRGARILDAGLGTGISGTLFSGLGERDFGTERALGGGIPYMDARGGLAGVVFAEGDWNECMLFRLRSGGVPSIGESWLLKVAI
jgi:hypothetical protein